MGGYTATFNALANVGNAVWPNRGKFGNFIMVGAALVAGAMDVAAERYARKPLPEDTLHRDRAKFWADKATELSAAPPVTVNIINQAGAVAAVPATPPSKYMMEEGHTGGIGTDCFACADAHLASIKAGLERAKGVVANTGECNQDCKDWLGFGVREGVTLLAGDWPDERVNALPPDQKAVIERYRQQVRDLTTGMLGGSKQAQALNEGHGYLDESVRFLNAGDPLDHPDVAGRFRDAVPNLTTAERTDIYHYDTDTANELRDIRQGVANKIDSPDALKEYWRRTRTLTTKVNDKAFDALNVNDIGPMADQAMTMYQNFRSDRIKAGMGS